jgi:hypothetical protein
MLLYLTLLSKIKYISPYVSNDEEIRMLINLQIK